MNKGRNLIVLMCCLLVLSLLTFLAKSRNTNKNAVVDDVRYVKVASNDNVTKYEFYFVEDFVMVGIMSTLEDGSKKINVSHRGDYIEETDEYEILDDYEYYYNEYTKKGWQIYIFYVGDIIENLQEKLDIISQYLANKDAKSMHQLKIDEFIK